MKSTLFILTLFAGLVLSASQAPRVKMVTTLGDIVIEVYDTQAPLTAKNFLHYVDVGGYDSASFYRTVTPQNQPDNHIKIEVVQGGLRDRESEFPPVLHETTRTTGIHHKDGVISMARSEPGTASSEFFICIGDQPELDFGGKRNSDLQGFAAFGRVVSGMDVVRAIQRQPAAGQFLTQPVRIISISRIQ